MGRTNKLVDGCYSFWLGGVFPILAGLLQEEREQEGQGQEQGSAPHHREQQQRPAAAAGSGLRPRGTHGLGALQQKGSTVANRAEASAMPDVANRLADMLLSGGTDWVASLDTAPPLEVAQRQLVRLQAELDAAVEASLAAEDALKVAVEGDAPGSRVEELKQEAVELVERSAEAQCNLEQGRSHVEFTTTSATVLLAAEGGEGGRAAGAAAGVTEGATAGGGSGSSRQPQLYNAQALQLWLLKCCQGVSELQAGLGAAGRWHGCGMSLGLPTCTPKHFTTYKHYNLRPPRACSLAVLQAHGGMKDKPGKAPDFYHTW